MKIYTEDINTNCVKNSKRFVLVQHLKRKHPHINFDFLYGYGDYCTHPKDSQYISDAGCYCQKCGEEITIKNK